MLDDPFLHPWICLAMMRLGSRMAAHFDERFVAEGVTQAQFRLMMAVYSEGGGQGISPSALAEHLLIERATVSVLANRLVERGLLERRPGENRRTHRLALTPAGLRLLAEVGPHAVALAREVLEGFDNADLWRLRETLEKLEAHIRKTAGQPAAEG